MVDDILNSGTRVVYKCDQGCGWQAGGKALADAIDDHLGNPRAVSDPAAFALDGYAGFGRSPEATLRDDTIAYAEAFERELEVAACMRGAGFEYAPAVAFPAERVADIAAGLGVAPGRAASESSASRNRAYARGLSDGDRERYYQSMLGESAADVAEADRTGEIPQGRGPDFATGGCVGAAATATPTSGTGSGRCASSSTRPSRRRPSYAPPGRVPSVRPGHRWHRRLGSR